MLFPTSGRWGFTQMSYPNKQRYDRSTLLAMLQRENEIRLSPELQQIFDDNVVRGEFGKVNNLFSQVQIQVLHEFGFKQDQILDGLNFLRSARSSYPDDEEILNAANYLKYNRSCQGDLKEGDDIPDVQLFTVNKSPINLLDYYHRSCRAQTQKHERALVILSGSLT